MAFRLNDRIYKEILYFTAFDLTTDDPLYVLTQLTDATIDITAESTDVTDKNGNLVKKIWKSKAGSFSATNAFVNSNIIAAASGSNADFAEQGNKIQMPKMIHVNKTAEKVTLTDYVDGSVKVAQYFGDGSIGKVYTVSETADAEHFQITSAGELTLPKDTDADMFFIKYTREVEAGSLIKNRADKFPSSVKVLIKATYFNPCQKNELKADYIEFPSFQVSPETSFPINADSATMDFSGDLEIDYCGSEKTLYNIYSADEIDED